MYPEASETANNNGKREVRVQTTAGVPTRLLFGHSFAATDAALLAVGALCGTARVSRISIRVDKDDLQETDQTAWEAYNGGDDTTNAKLRLYIVITPRTASEHYEGGELVRHRL